MTIIAREVARPTVGEVLDRAVRRAEHAALSALDVLDDVRSDVRSERDIEVGHRTGR